MYHHSEMSDEELQLRLKDYGISTPVTASTRSVLIKKLKTFTSNSITSKHSKLNSFGGNARKSFTEETNTALSSFSSDEEDMPGMLIFSQ